MKAWIFLLFFHASAASEVQRRSPTEVDTLDRAEDLSIVAIENKNAQTLLNQFALNWTLNRDDVGVDQDRQLTLLSRSIYYDGEKNYAADLKTGLTKEQLVRQWSLAVQQYKVSPAFDAQFRRALDLADGECQYFYDDELVFFDKVLQYNRFGFLKQSKTRDKFAYVQVVYGAEFPHIRSNTVKFLTCAIDYEKRENSDLSRECQARFAPGFSDIDWLVFKIWIRARALTPFMEFAGPKKRRIDENMHTLEQYLPADYEPLQKCSLFGPDPQGCHAMVDPKIGIAVGLAEKLGDNQFDNVTLKKIDKLLINVRVKNDTQFFCNLTSENIERHYDQWKSEKFINDKFAHELQSSLSERQDSGSYVRDTFFVSDTDELRKNKAQFARILVYKEQDMWSIVGVFIEIQTGKKLTVTNQTPKPCDKEQQYCVVDQIKFSDATMDPILKKYVVSKAIDALTARKVLIKRMDRMTREEDQDDGEETGEQQES